jgi:hypothetical protein
MTDDLRPAGEEDPGADTERFRRFATTQDDGATAAPGGTSATGSSTRVIALVGGLVVLALIVWLLVQNLG